MHEALLFSAQLRLIDVSKDKMHKFVDEVGPPFCHVILQPWRVGHGGFHLTMSAVPSAPICRRAHYSCLRLMQYAQCARVRNPVLMEMNIVHMSFTS